MKKKLLTILLVSSLLLLSACGSNSSDSVSENDDASSQETTSTNEDYATKENPADPTEKITLDGSYGCFSFQLNCTYVGNDATEFLSSIGESLEDYTLTDENDKLVVLEYTVSADEGFDNYPFFWGDVVGNDLWDTEFGSKYNYCVFDLYENASLDYYQLTLENGEESTMYEVLELPSEVNTYIASVSDGDRKYWFRYNLTE